MADIESGLTSRTPRATRPDAPQHAAAIPETMVQASELSVFVGSPPEDAPKPRAKRKWRTKRWIRTRDKEQLGFFKLQLDVNDLRQEIMYLQTTYSLLYARILNGQDAYIQTVVQYYDMMHGGFHDVLRPQNGGDCVDGRQYLYSIIDQDIRMGRLPGLDQFITMWRRYTVAFEDLHFSLASARLLPADPYGDHTDDREEVVVVAESRFEARMGLQVIQYVFPSLVEKPWLMDRVLGQTLRGEGQLRLAFDTRSRRVVKVDMTLDIVGALFRVVRDPRVVNEVLDGALLTPDCCIGDLRQFMLLPDPDDEQIQNEPFKTELDEGIDVKSEAKMVKQAWQMTMDALLSPTDVESTVDGL